MESNDCPYGCQRYRQSIEEVTLAGNKHREKSLALKEIAEEQKRKISNLREDRNELLDKVTQLESREKSQRDLIIRMTRETRDLKITLRDLRLDVVKKDEIIDENMKEIMNMKVIKKKCNDFEDEIILKDQKIYDLENILENSPKVVEEQVPISLHEELSGSFEKNSVLEEKIESLEADLQTFKAKEDLKSSERIEILNHIKRIEMSKKEQMDNLKEGLSKVKSNVFQPAGL